MTIALILDGEPGAYHRDVSVAALQHVIDGAASDTTVEVVQSGDLRARNSDEFSGVFVGPGSPYADASAVIDWIRDAREGGVPLVGT